MMMKPDVNPLALPVLKPFQADHPPAFHIKDPTLRGLTVGDAVTNPCSGPFCRHVRNRRAAPAGDASTASGCQRLARGLGLSSEDGQDIEHGPRVERHKYDQGRPNVVEVAGSAKQQGDTDGERPRQSIAGGDQRRPVVSWRVIQHVGRLALDGALLAEGQQGEYERMEVRDLPVLDDVDDQRQGAGEQRAQARRSSGEIGHTGPQETARDHTDAARHHEHA